MIVGTLFCACGSSALDGADAMQTDAGGDLEESGPLDDAAVDAARTTDGEVGGASDLSAAGDVLPSLDVAPNDSMGMQTPDANDAFVFVPKDLSNHADLPVMVDLSMYSASDVCTSDADCVGNPRGPVCHPRGYCGCTSDASCAAFPGTVCGISAAASYSPACQVPCTSSVSCGGYACVGGRCAECASDNDCFSHHCNQNTGECIACTSNSDCSFSPFHDFDCYLPEGECVRCFVDAECPATQPHCLATSTFHGCLECRNDLDCVASPHGSHCNDENACDCRGAADCTQPAAEGGTCLLGSIPSYCGCASNADCTGNLHGPTCVPSLAQCSCSTDADCTTPPFTRCAQVYDFGGFSQCSKACATDADCAGKPTLPYCNSGSGLCVQCRGDGDCTDASHPHCSPTQGLCVRCVADSQCPATRPVCAPSGDCRECRSDGDCATNRAGGICDTSSGRCTCNSDADCVGADTKGSKCGTSISGKRCGCDSDAACVGNTHGPQCMIFDGYGSCTCHAGNNADCTVAPYTICAVINTISNASMCDAPCISDASCDWVDTGLSHCDTQSMMCVGCVSNADCANQGFNDTCSPQGNCVECVTSGDCDAASLGNQCGNSHCRCLTGADCAGNLNGRLCDSTSFVCHCMTDADCPSGRTCSSSVMPAGTIVSICQ